MATSAGVRKCKSMWSKEVPDISFLVLKSLSGYGEI